MGNQKLSITEGQTTQWPKDTKLVIRSCQSQKDRQNNGHKIPNGYSETVNRRRTDNTMAKDTKWVIRGWQTQKDRQHNDQKIPNG